MLSHFRLPSATRRESPYLWQSKSFRLGARSVTHYHRDSLSLQLWQQGAEDNTCCLLFQKRRRKKHEETSEAKLEGWPLHIVTEGAERALSFRERS